MLIMWQCLFLCCLLAVAASAECPSYTFIAQPSVAAWSPQIYQGLWYQIATDEPTMPSFCNCATLNWTVTGPATFTDHFAARCGLNLSFALRGSLSTNASEPSNLKEGVAAGLEVPNMVFNVTIDAAGQYTTARVFSCLGLGLYSFQLLSRVPVVAPSAVHAMLQEVAAIGIDVSRVKIFNFTDCGF
jgi:hypothetical protein